MIRYIRTGPDTGKRIGISFRVTSAGTIRLYWWTNASLRGVYGCAYDGRSIGKVVRICDRVAQIDRMTLAWIPEPEYCTRQ